VDWRDLNNGGDDGNAQVNQIPSLSKETSPVNQKAKQYLHQEYDSDGSL
jgi:hypothetical protein